MFGFKTKMNQLINREKKTDLLSQCYSKQGEIARRVSSRSNSSHYLYWGIVGLMIIGTNTGENKCLYQEAQNLPNWGYLPDVEVPLEI